MSVVVELYSKELGVLQSFDKQHALNLLNRNANRLVKTWELPEKSKFEYKDGDIIRKKHSRTGSQWKLNLSS